MTPLVKRNLYIAFALVVLDSLIWFAVINNKAPHWMDWFAYGNLLLGILAPLTGFIYLFVIGSINKGWGSIVYLSSLILNFYIPVFIGFAQYLDTSHRDSVLSFIFSYPGLMLVLAFFQLAIFFSKAIGRKKDDKIEDELPVKNHHRRLLVYFIISVILAAIPEILSYYLFRNGHFDYYELICLRYSTILFWLSPLAGAMFLLYFIITRRSCKNILYFTVMNINFSFLLGFATGMIHEARGTYVWFTIYNQDLVLMALIAVIFILQFLALFGMKSSGKIPAIPMQRDSLLE